MGKLFDITLGNKREKRRAKNQFARDLFGKKTVFLVAAGIMGYVILSNVSYSGSSKETSPAPKPEEVGMGPISGFSGVY